MPALVLARTIYSVSGTLELDTVLVPGESLQNVQDSLPSADGEPDNFLSPRCKRRLEGILKREYSHNPGLGSISGMPSLLRSLPTSHNLHGYSSEYAPSSTWGSMPLYPQFVAYEARQQAGHVLSTSLMMRYVVDDTEMIATYQRNVWQPFSSRFSR